jgi:regulator of protease activity HflC (stomatin/prohibitin superfamily)
MGWIISMVFAVVICTVVFWVGVALVRDGRGKKAEVEALPDYERSEKLKDADGETATGWAIVGVSILLFFIWAGLHTVTATVHTVPAGHNGVVREFGAIVAQTGDGLQLTPPWRSLDKADTRVQTWVFSDDEDKVPDGAKLAGNVLSSFSEETQDVFIDATLNIEVSPEDIQELYRNVGSDYFNKLVPTRVRQLFKNETVKYKAVDIAPNRETIRTNVEENLRVELRKFSIDVVALLIDDIDFNDPFKDAIEAKQVATQNAQEEAERITQRENEALQVIAEAEGTKQATITIAEGQAEANRLLDASLTPNVILFQAVQKLADDLKIALIPAGEGILIDPTTLLTPPE